MEGESSSKKISIPSDHGFVAKMFSWSLEDIYNENLYKVEMIPESFQSIQQYFGSFVVPLLEETRAQLHSSMGIISEAPFAEVVALSPSRSDKKMLYDVKIDYWRKRFNEHGKEPYKTLPGDVIVLADAKPETASDLCRVGRTWNLAVVTNITDDDEDASTSTYFKVEASKNIEVGDGMQKSLFVIFLINITTNRRIWNALHMCGNLNIIKKVLDFNSEVEENCSFCFMRSIRTWDGSFFTNLLSELNDSQTEAVLDCLSKMQCNHRSPVGLIWGPPGTGKTKTISLLLLTLLRLKCRTLTCAPTNVAITEVASRVLKLVTDSFETESGTGTLFCSLGDILLFGNKERLKVKSAIEKIYLDYRVERLVECLAPLTGWRHCLNTTIDFFEDCASQYSIFLDNELIKEQELKNGDEKKEKSLNVETDSCNGEHKSLLEYARDRFCSTMLPLERCVAILCTHLPESYILKHNLQKLKSLFGLLDSFKTLLFSHGVTSEDVEKIFSHPEDSSEAYTDVLLSFQSYKRQCLSELKALRSSLNELKLPGVMSKDPIKELCFRNASLIFCTASSSYKLHSIAMEPLRMLVIDEASQLKESESAIPLQLPGISHAILIGDECQLPAMVESKLSDEAGFGKSLFERLSLLGHPKHLLNMQYRMHPSISCFPNSNFYFNKILDAPNVRCRSYEKHYLSGPMFGPYSFINVSYGREERDDDERSRRNMVEVAVVLKLVQNLYKEWNVSKHCLTIGVISPYAAQVFAIQAKLGKRYENDKGFSVKVNSIDGFQGGEEDIIIISTVRSNSAGAIGFVSNPRRVNVSLTRARHCLWILGNERTLLRSESVWENVVCDAKYRQCFFNADEDKDLAKAILEVKKEFDQLDDLLNGDSILFKCSRWKVLFSEYFRKSFGKLASVQKKTSVLNLLLKLSSGWRPKKRNVNLTSESSSQILKQFKVEGFYIICSIDLVKEKMNYVQVLKVWDILPLEDIPRLVKRLNGIFERYTDEFISHCNEKCLDGDLEVPKTWSTSFDIVRYKSVSSGEGRSDSDCGASNAGCYVENSRVSDSLLLMKFYSLSSGVVKHLLSDANGGELELPFEVTDEELEIILFQRSTFILGRSGTGKTTVLTMKLFQKEQMFHMAVEGFGEGTHNSSKDDNVKEAEEGVGEAKKIVLRQLFVTVSPKLCHAVKHHVSHLKSFASGGQYSAESSSFDAENIDHMAQFKDIPNSFFDIPSKSYPLVLTFSKFLMMLDGTMGNSYFERFHEVRQFALDKTGNLGSIAMQTFMETREVNYEKFCSIYWPHFDAKMTKKLDSSRVFTEIMSHIKGGLQARESCDGRLARDDYVTLSEGRISTLSREKREMIYDIYVDYEKMKVDNGDFDLADFVIDLHFRLQKEKYEGDVMDFVYIDEVQDLTMRQIALFKHICRNVIDGFVFSGDTAQTIARGIDFRFEDIRSLFYNEFIMGSRNEGRKEKGQISKIFHLSQNFRTHAGILKLAQSVIDLLYRFFRSFVDILSHETSLIFGEAPIWLEAGNDENAIVTIFGNNGNEASTFVGFGAEQVILVRDDAARKEICGHVRKQALVLTIVECKGLEFQDVLLYNFFGSSPLRNKWRVIYEYMKEQDLVDASSSKSFPSFNMAKHNVLCSELKQLYVAITRTRQRLWICENFEEFSKPMFDYWKKKALVQVRRLDDSLAQAMKVASTPEEWKSRGYKLLQECNYEMATMCFERAGDEHGEKLAKALGLKASADRMHGSNPEMASVARRQAAEIFESIGKTEHAAECFYLLEEYERAGRIYMQCGESSMERAGECFCLARCYELAAEVYARCHQFSKCLSACTEGKLFHMGLHYVQCWKHDVTPENYVITRSKEMEKIEQDFLENCALHYHGIKDNKSMMRYVRAFDSMDSTRAFLKNLGCLDELLTLEEELGNFLEAAKIAKLKGDLILEADLLGKAGQYKHASMLILCYVFANSLWSAGSKGWPLKHFAQKGELLEKAKSFAKKESNQLYELVCVEAEILSDEQSDLVTMKHLLNTCMRHKSIRGEVLTARKILDAHLHINASAYIWANYIVLDLARLVEDKFSKNQVTVETLVYSWTFWRDKIMNIFECLESLETQVVNEYGSYGEFCMNFFGVQRDFSNLDATYLPLISNAEWVREVDSRHKRWNGRHISLDVHQFVSASRGYWSSELLSVGIKVLVYLESLYIFSIKNSLSLFCQSNSLFHIYEVAKFLLNCKFLDQHQRNNKELRKYVGLPIEQIFGCMYPLDWRESLEENLISFRRTETYKNVLKEMIFYHVSWKCKFSYGQLGKIALIILGSGKFYGGLFEKMADAIKGNSAWSALIKNLCSNAALELLSGSSFEVPGELSLRWFLHEALVDVYKTNWRKEYDYISPGCFLYFLERQLILLSYSHGYFITSKSSFVEWLIYQEGSGSQSSSSVEQVIQSTDGMLRSVIDIVHQFLYNWKDTMEWITKCHASVKNENVKDCQAVVVLRLVVIICLIYLNFGLCKDLLFDLFTRNYITEQLPKEFCEAIGKKKKRMSLNLDKNVLTQAFKKIGNSLVIVRLDRYDSRNLFPDAILIDMKANQSKDDVLRKLFPGMNKAAQEHTEAVEVSTGSSCKGIDSPGSYDEGNRSGIPSSVICSVKDGRPNIPEKQEGTIPLSHDQLWQLLENFQSMNHGRDEGNRVIVAPMIKVDIEKIIHRVSAEIDGCSQKNHLDNKYRSLFGEATSMLDELKQLCAALDVSEEKLENGLPAIEELLNKLLSRRPRMEPFLGQMNAMQAEIASGIQASSGDTENKGKGNNKSKKSKKGKGGRKHK